MHGRKRIFPCILAGICLGSAGAQERRPAPNPVVRVVTISTDRVAQDGKGLLDAKLQRLDEAASFQPDIACLPEMSLSTAAEPVPGPTTTRVGEWARRHSSYVVVGMKTLVNGCKHNSAVLLNRRGEVVGRFDKIHPTTPELEQGIIPGAVDPPVFATDFGTIGIQICFDVNWWDTWTRLKEKGARIVFFPAAYPAAEQLSAIALMNEFFVVSSTWARSSRIYDITGKVLSASGHYQPWTGAVLPLGRKLYEVGAPKDAVSRIQQKYGPKVEVSWYHDDDWFTLTSRDPELTVDEIEKEFGLISRRDGLMQAEKAIDAARRRAEAGQ